MSAFLGGHDLSGSSQALKSLWKIQWQMSQEPVAQWKTGHWTELQEWRPARYYLLSSTQEAP